MENLHVKYRDALRKRVLARRAITIIRRVREIFCHYVDEDVIYDDGYLYRG